MKPVIHSKPERKKKHRLARNLYRQRYLVEIFFHNLKRFRAIATRYEKTARNYLAIRQVACAALAQVGVGLRQPSKGLEERTSGVKRKHRARAGGEKSLGGAYAGAASPSAGKLANRSTSERRVARAEGLAAGESRARTT
jgi:hypothetical protein